MFNYTNLNDVEFEALCKDVMEKKLSVKLRLFAKGKDGGIDLTDDTRTHKIIVQVKHYIGSKFPNLRATLRSEIANVHKWNPDQYYVCCGMEITDLNTREIYDMFSDFMDTDQNIITLKEIDEFLQMPENIDVVRKHYKLWLYASNILSEVFNQDIFIDCESLLSDIDEESKYFVQTDIYEQCIEHLDKYGLLMITGGPGVGKTLTSKMLVLFYATQGYRVRYTTNGDISDIKKSLSSDKECKEIVLLDDCLGQHYFCMKQTQESELLTLIKYIRLSKHKKLILNSRVTIFNEAKERSLEFNTFFQEKKIKNFIINMDEITHLEKAKIFYNHLIYRQIPCEYYSTVKKNKNYLSIVQHSNYTPRIIEHITFKVNYLKVPPAKYIDYIIDNLAHPHDIWKNEFERRLQGVDRAFLSTLYSLTDTNIYYGILKKCFNNRLSHMENVDYTVDNYELVISRLNQSIINIIDNKGRMFIGVINPSVNDYMKSVFTNNKLELNEVRKSICIYEQFERCYTKEELPNIFGQLLINGDINDMDFMIEDAKDYFITAQICNHNLKDVRYKQVIFNYLNNSYGGFFFQTDWLSHIEIMEVLLNDELYLYYCISEFILEEDCMKRLLLDLELEELIDTINLMTECYEKNCIEVPWFIGLCKERINDAINSYAENIDAPSYCEDYDIKEIISQNLKVFYGYRDDEEYDCDTDAAIRTLKRWIAEDVKSEIQEKLDLLDEIVFDSSSLLIVDNNINTDGIESIIESYFEPDVPDYDDYEPTGSDTYISEIEAIFER